MPVRRQEVTRKKQERKTAQAKIDTPAAAVQPKRQIRCARGPGDLSGVEPVLVARGALGHPDGKSTTTEKTQDDSHTQGKWQINRRNADG